MRGEYRAAGRAAVLFLLFFSIYDIIFFIFISALFFILYIVIVIDFMIHVSVFFIYVIFFSYSKSVLVLI